MKIVTFAASKGGVGKTSLCATLSAFAARSNKVVITDLDPQGSLTSWWNKREAETPYFLESSRDTLKETIKTAEQNGFDYLFIDTPPAFMEAIDEAIKLADFILVPCQPSPIDLDAISRTLESIEENNKPFAFVINRIIARTRIGAQTTSLLANHGRIAGIPIAQRTPYATAFIDGRTAPELTEGKQAEEEMFELWNFLQTNLKKKS